MQEDENYFFVYFFTITFGLYRCEKAIKKRPCLEHSLSNSLSRRMRVSIILASVFMVGGINYHPIRFPNR